MIVYRHVDRRRRRLMETDIGCVAHNTDYFEPAVTAGRGQSEWVGWLDVIGHSNAPSDRGFVRPPRTSLRLVDDGDVGRSTGSSRFGSMRMGANPARRSCSQLNPCKTTYRFVFLTHSALLWCPLFPRRYRVGASRSTPRDSTPDGSHRRAGRQVFLTPPAPDLLGPCLEHHVERRFRGAPHAWNPPSFTRMSRSRCSPACAPSAGPFFASDTGTQTIVDAP